MNPGLGQTASRSPYRGPYEALAAWAGRSPQGEGLAFPETGSRMSFAAWRDEAGALARALLGLGLRPGDHIGLQAENRLEWPVVQVGVAAMGGVLVPLNTHYRRDDLAYALRQSRTKALFLSPRFRSNDYRAMLDAARSELPELRWAISLDEAAGAELAYADLIGKGRGLSMDLPEVPPEAVGSLQYTSGTTGRPKGALLTHHGMMENAWQTGRRLGFRPGDRYTSIIPLFHCAGCIMGLLNCLQNGAAYVGVSAFDPEAMFRVIEGERCTALSGVPTSYLAMLNHPARRRYDLSSLRTGTCGGADANPDILKACAAEFPMPELVQVYGQTEASTLISMADHRDPDRVSDAGRPFDGYEVRIVDPASDQALGPGEIGEIQARGDMTMVGYYENPDATAETLTPEGWLRTGDLGFLAADGRLTIAGGRLRDMIIRGGENIYPAEIENLLVQHPAVAEVAVFGMPDAYYGEIVAAALRLRGAAQPGALVAHCQDRIARFKVPARWFRVEAFPMTSSGKIRKVELRELAGRGQLEELP